MNRKMKDCGVGWIGEIPESWELRKLKYILDERKEKIILLLRITYYLFLLRRAFFPIQKKQVVVIKLKMI
ncbi:hypothetical protein B645_06015 [Enterococcus hirae 88-15-E09]|nr:hypothetical protein B645_06015 [Enterococcus hirae 88-15-E09]